MKLSEAQALAEQAIYDYTSSTKWQEVKYMNWTTAEMQDVIAKALVKNINVIHCCKSDSELFICRDCDKITKEYRDNLCEPCHKWHTGT